MNIIKSWKLDLNSGQFFADRQVFAQPFQSCPTDRQLLALGQASVELSISLRGEQLSTLCFEPQQRAQMELLAARLLGRPDWEESWDGDHRMDYRWGRVDVNDTNITVSYETCQITSCTDLPKPARALSFQPWTRRLLLAGAGYLGQLVDGELSLAPPGLAAGPASPDRRGLQHPFQRLRRQNSCLILELDIYGLSFTTNGRVLFAAGDGPRPVARLELREDRWICVDSFDLPGKPGPAAEVVLRPKGLAVRQLSGVEWLPAPADLEEQDSAAGLGSTNLACYGLFGAVTSCGDRLLYGDRRRSGWLRTPSPITSLLADRKQVMTGHADGSVRYWNMPLNSASAPAACHRPRPGVAVVGMVKGRDVGGWGVVLVFGDGSTNLPGPWSVPEGIPTTVAAMRLPTRADQPNQWGIAIGVKLPSGEGRVYSVLNEFHCCI